MKKVLPMAREARLFHAGRIPCMSIGASGVQASTHKILTSRRTKNRAVSATTGCLMLDQTSGCAIKYFRFSDPKNAE